MNTKEFMDLDVSPFFTSCYDPSEYGDRDEPISYSLCLSQSYFWYDFKELKNMGKDSKYGSGHEYEIIFQNYLGDIGFKYNSDLHYDSENGMFCVYSDNADAIVACANELIPLMKDEKKMLKLIAEANKYYGWRW